MTRKERRVRNVYEIPINWDEVFVGKKLLIIDGDGTATKIENDSWERWNLKIFQLARDEGIIFDEEEHLNAINRVVKNFEDTFKSLALIKKSDAVLIQGLSKQFSDEIMKLWTFEGRLKINKKQILEEIESIPTRFGLNEFVEAAKVAGLEVYIITASYDLFGEYLARKLGIAVVTNTMTIWDEDGNLAGIQPYGDYVNHKATQLTQIVEELSGKGIVITDFKRQILAIGDRYTDVALARLTTMIAMDTNFQELLDLARAYTIGFPTLLKHFWQFMRRSN